MILISDGKSEHVAHVFVENRCFLKKKSSRAKSLQLQQDPSLWVEKYRSEGRYHTLANLETVKHA